MLCLLTFHYYDQDNTGFNHKYNGEATAEELAIRKENDGDMYPGFNPMMAESSKMDSLGLVDMLVKTLVPSLHLAEFRQHVERWCCDDAALCVARHGSNYFRSIMSWAFTTTHGRVRIATRLTASISFLGLGLRASVLLSSSCSADCVRIPTIEHPHYGALAASLSCTFPRRCTT